MGEIAQQQREYQLVVSLRHGAIYKILPAADVVSITDDVEEDEEEDSDEDQNKKEKIFSVGCMSCNGYENTISGPVAGKNVTVIGKWIYGS